MKKTFYSSVIALLFLAGCGGGGGTPGTCVGTDAVCAPAKTDSPSALANICTPEGEKRWVRAHLDDVYLWYKDIVEVPPANYSTPADYFNALIVRSKDRFSFTAPREEIDRYFESGEDVSYGATFVNASGRLRVAYTEANSPAAENNIQRGAEIVSINGTPISSMSREAQIAALYPSNAGETNQFGIMDVGASASRNVQLTAKSIAKAPVFQSTILNVDGNKRVGYMVFNDHVATAEEPLISAFAEFKQSGIEDLVLDMRYNGGGFLYIASEVGTMIGGAAVQGKVFEQLVFNDKHPERTSDPRNRIDFRTTSTTNQPLPQLNLKRVFVLTGRNTCSASEAIINGLRPFVEVITIGGTTCGKPYGFIQTNNCGQAYFATQFAGVNALGQGDYTNGFAPACAATDDLDRQLGDVNERLLATALGYRTTGSCPTVSYSQSAGAAYTPAPTLEVYRQPWRDQRIH